MVAKKQPQSIDMKILFRIYGKGRGCVFTPNDFTDLGSQDAVHQALSRHARADTIRKLARGLYDYPRKHPQLGLIPPSDENIANGRHSTRIQLSGAHAANMLGLSTQVPMRTVFLTDGDSRKVQLDRRQIVLKKTTPRQMATAGRASGMVIQALRWLGAANVNDKAIATLKRRLGPDEKKQLLADVRHAPAWVAQIMRQVAAP
jgi:Family of unknown function (DUF6088)